MMQSVFITATDTDAGKTYSSIALARALAGAGYRVAGFKPVSAGADWQDGQLVNEDARLLQQYCSAEQSIQAINPIVFEPAIAPHIAAAQQGQTINIESLTPHYQQFQQTKADFGLVEGAGGWLLPLNRQQTMAEFVIGQGLPIIVVVDLKLGCLNHTLLTIESIQASNGQLLGWIANNYRAMPYGSENLEFLVDKLPCPLIATLDNTPIEQLDITKFNLSPLLNLIQTAP